MIKQGIISSRPDYRWIHGIAVVLSLFLLILLVQDIVAVLSDDTSYPFGWEGGGVRYSSMLMYLALSAFEVLLCLAVVITFLAKTSKKLTRLLLVIWTLYYVLLLASLIS